MVPISAHVECSLLFPVWPTHIHGAWAATKSSDPHSPPTDTGLTPATDTSRATVYNPSNKTSLKINTPWLHALMATWNPPLPQHQHHQNSP